MEQEQTTNQEQNVRYLDPKADIPFRKVFGENKDLLISLLNAFLPLEKDTEIKEVEYLQTELLPALANLKDSVVDVRCTDSKDRQIVVEMQMVWSPSFMKRVVFNASKAYTLELEKGKWYSDLKPVYALSILNGVFDTDPDYYHEYRILNVKDREKSIDEIRYFFVELPKFNPEKFSGDKMRELWLRYFTVMDTAEEAPKELLDNPQTKKAVEILEKSAYTKAQLISYYRYMDDVRKLHDIIHDKDVEVRESRKQGMEEGKLVAKKEQAKKMKEDGMSIELISKYTGLSGEEIEKL